jgi:hypothetical protein
MPYNCVRSKPAPAVQLWTHDCRPSNSSGRSATIAHMQVLQREFWNGPPERLPDAFTLSKRKGDATLNAACETWTHPFGWELRLMIEGHGLQMSSVVRSAEEMLATVDTWKAAMIEKGWS